MTEILELFGESTSTTADWPTLVREQQCPFLQRKCIKIRKASRTYPSAHALSPTDAVVNRW